MSAKPVERPILFAGPMIKAILEGKKTQTRRAVRETSDKTTRVYFASETDTVPPGKYAGWVRECDAPLGLPLKCPYGATGDRLWVRETHLRGDRPGATVWYRATEPERVHGSVRWTPSIHMPRWASRLTLEVTAVRVERLQEITDADARAEGVTQIPGAGGAVYPGTCAYRRPSSYREAFARLWDGINGVGSWKSSPFVWVIEFKRICQCESDVPDPGPTHIATCPHNDPTYDAEVI